MIGAFNQSLNLIHLQLTSFVTMAFQLNDLITYSFYYNYFIICLLVAISNRNEEFIIVKFTKPIKLYLSATFLILIPSYEWYYVSYRGSYFPSNIFVYELIIGLLLFYFGKTVARFIYKKKNSILSLICTVATIWLCFAIKKEIKFIMTLP